MPPANVTKNINCKSTLTANVYLPGNVFTQVTEKPFLSNFSRAFHKRQGLLVGDTEQTYVQWEKEAALSHPSSCFSQDVFNSFFFSGAICD